MESWKVLGPKAVRVQYSRTYEQWLDSLKIVCVVMIPLKSFKASRRLLLTRIRHLSRLLDDHHVTFSIAEKSRNLQAERSQHHDQFLDGNRHAGGGAVTIQSDSDDFTAGRQ